MGTASASRRRFAISSKRPTGCLSSNGLLGDGVGAEHAVGDAGTEGMIGGMEALALEALDHELCDGALGDSQAEAASWLAM